MNAKQTAEAILFFPVICLLAAAAFAAFSAIIAASWYALLGWLWLWTIVLPLPRVVGGPLALICAALTIYGGFRLLGRLIR